MVHVSISNNTPLMDIVATVGDESKTFPVKGKAYGPEHDAASDKALVWIKERCNATSK